MRTLVLTGSLAALALVPVVATLAGEPFYLTLFARIIVFAIAALSLDLILGFGGLVSFGHAAYLGVGAYAVGVLSFHGVTSGLAHLLAAVAASAVTAAAIGAVSLRTAGVYFIMITLAFAQMLYFLGVSLKHYGGDDGMTLASRSQLGGLVDLKNGVVFYYLALGVLALFLYLGHRLVHSRFGMVIRGIRSNEPRMRAIGFPTFRYKLAAFVIAGAMCGVAGGLLANLTEFVTPAFMHWTRSGEILVMVILGIGRCMIGLRWRGRGRGAGPGSSAPRSTRDASGAIREAAMTPLYFEDFAVGRRFRTPGLTLTEAAIIHFAERFDRQPFHLDVEAAKATPFGGLIASGIHTIAVTFSLFIQTGAVADCSLGSPGLDEVRWLQPVRPGDTLHAEVEVVAARPSSSKPDRGIVTTSYVTFNQRGETVMTMRSHQLLRRRPGA